MGGGGGGGLINYRSRLGSGIGLILYVGQAFSWLLIPPYLACSIAVCTLDLCTCTEVYMLYS